MIWNDSKLKSPLVFFRTCQVSQQFKFFGKKKNYNFDIFAKKDDTTLSLNVRARWTLRIFGWSRLFSSESWRCCCCCCFCSSCCCYCFLLFLLKTTAASRVFIWLTLSLLLLFLLVLFLFLLLLLLFKKRLQVVFLYGWHCRYCYYFC